SRNVCSYSASPRLHSHAAMSTLGSRQVTAAVIYGGFLSNLPVPSNGGKASNRRISPVAAGSGEGPLTELAAAPPPRRQQRRPRPQNGHSVSAVDTRAGRCRGRRGHSLAGAPASPELRRQLCNALRLMSGEEVGVTDGGDDMVVVVYFVENAVMAPHVE